MEAICYKIYLRRYKSLFERLEIRYILLILGSWIRIRIPNTDPDPEEPNQRGSGSTELRGRFITFFVKWLFLTFVRVLETHLALHFGSSGYGSNQPESMRIRIRNRFVW
jgi:hypothetical protein